jgi:predicted kinase
MEYLEEASGAYLDKFKELLRNRDDIVLDRSFYAREDRDEFRRMIAPTGARVILVYFKGSKDVLWRRICERRAKGVTADSALEIGESLLDDYVCGFEAPENENEVVIEI